MLYIIGAVAGVTSVLIVGSISNDALFFLGFGVGTAYVLITNNRKLREEIRYVFIGLALTIFSGFTYFLLPLDIRFLYGFAFGYLTVSIRRQKGDNYGKSNEK